MNTWRKLAWQRGPAQHLMVLWSNTDYVTVLLHWGFCLKSRGAKLIRGIYTYMIKEPHNLRFRHEEKKKEHAWTNNMAIIIICKGHSVHGKMNWSDFHSCKWVSCVFISAETSFGKHGLENIIMFSCGRAQWASNSNRSLLFISLPRRWGNAPCVPCPS